MIIPNGTIELKLKVEAHQVIDPKTGYPTKPQQATWSEPIACQALPNSRNNLGRINGEHFTTASYTVLIEEQPLPDFEQVRLTDTRTGAQREFSLLAPPESLEAVCQIKLLI
jgi:hypothetical protein